MPTPVTFPDFCPPSKSPVSWDAENFPDFFHTFISLRRPSDIDERHLSALNLSFETDCSFEALVPPADSGESFLPPREWLQEGASVTSGENAEKTLSNGRRAPKVDDFQFRLKELTHPNYDAFASLSRGPGDVQKIARLVHFRRFWEGLDSMAQYWDTSLDHYILPKEESQPQSERGSDQPSDVALPSSSQGQAGPLEPRKKHKSNSNHTLHIDSPSESSASNTLSPTSETTHPPTHAQMSSPDANRRTESAPLGTYKGKRISCGAKMPEHHRPDTVRTFIEPIAWAFGVSLAPQRRMPYLSIKNMRLPVRVTLGGWRMPQDRARARIGFLEGPAFGIQCRAEVDFGTGEKAKAAGTLDVVRELGGLLMIAQERAREGKSEAKPGEEKWWTTAPRWGGGPGGEIGEGEGAGDSPPESKELRRGSATNYEKRRRAAVEAWKTVRAGSGFWDPKTSYEAIGKARDSEWDEVIAGTMECSKAS